MKRLVRCLIFSKKGLENCCTLLTIITYCQLLMVLGIQSRYSIKFSSATLPTRTMIDLLPNSELLQLHQVRNTAVQPESSYSRLTTRTLQQEPLQLLQSLRQNISLLYVNLHLDKNQICQAQTTFAEGAEYGNYVLHNQMINNFHPDVKLEFCFGPPFASYKLQDYKIGKLSCMSVQEADCRTNASRARSDAFKSCVRYSVSVVLSARRSCLKGKQIKNGQNHGFSFKFYVCYGTNMMLKR